MPDIVLNTLHSLSQLMQQLSAVCSIVIHTLKMRSKYCCLVAKLCLTLCDLWTVVCQAPLSMEFPRQQYWSGLPFPSAGHLPHPRSKHRSPALQADSFTAEPLGKPSEYLIYFNNVSVLTSGMATDALSQGTIQTFKNASMT